MEHMNNSCFYHILNKITRIVVNFNDLQSNNVNTIAYVPIVYTAQHMHQFVYFLRLCAFSTLSELKQHKENCSPSWKLTKALAKSLQMQEANRTTEQLIWSRRLHKQTTWLPARWYDCMSRELHLGRLHLENRLSKTIRHLSSVLISD